MEKYQLIKVQTLVIGDRIVAGKAAQMRTCLFNNLDIVTDRTAEFIIRDYWEWQQLIFNPINVSVETVNNGIHQ